MERIDILCTSDIHGFIEGVNGKESFYNTLKEIIKEYPYAIVIDNGDYLTGSRLASFFNSQQPQPHPHPFIDLANMIGYDVMIPGNHEFDLGLSRLKELTYDVWGSYICANLLYENGEHVFKPWCLIERGGFKVGIIGLVTGNLSQLTEVENLEGIRIERPIAILNELIPDIRKQVDILIVSYHGGIERNMKSGKWTQYDTGEDEAYQIIETFPEIDGLICGHQHREQVGIKNKTLYVQPGYGGSTIGRLTLVKERGKTLLKEAELIPASEKGESDCITNFTLKWEKEFHRWNLEPMDLSYFPDFIKKHSPCDGFLLKVCDDTRDQFYKSFTPPYYVTLYQFSREEWENIRKQYDGSENLGNILMEETSLPEKKWYRILSNIKDLPYDRIIQQFLVNIPDVYEMELFHKRIEENQEK